MMNEFELPSALIRILVLLMKLIILCYYLYNFIARTVKQLN